MLWNYLLIGLNIEFKYLNPDFDWHSLFVPEFAESTCRNNHCFHWIFNIFIEITGLFMSFNDQWIHIDLVKTTKQGFLYTLEVFYLVNFLKNVGAIYKNLMQAHISAVIF